MLQMSQHSLRVSGLRHLHYLRQGVLRATLTVIPDPFYADTINAVDVIASRLRHLHYLRQGVHRATLTEYEVKG